MNEPTVPDVKQTNMCRSNLKRSKKAKTLRDFSCAFFLNLPCGESATTSKVTRVAVYCARYIKYLRYAPSVERRTHSFSLDVPIRWLELEA